MQVLMRQASTAPETENIYQAGVWAVHKLLFNIDLLLKYFNICFTLETPTKSLKTSKQKHDKHNMDKIM